MRKNKNAASKGRSKVVNMIVLAVTLSAILGTSTCKPQPAEDTSLRIGVLPILETMPIYVAEQEGYFAEQGIQVELVPFSSAIERDTAMQTGQIDGELNDLISAALLNKDEDRVRVVRTSTETTDEWPMWSILAAPDSGIDSADDLRGVEIAISTNTVIDYMTHHILVAEGLAPEDIATIEVAKIPIRLEMLLSGQVQAATLPDPLASLAIKQGARRIADDRDYRIRVSVISLSTQALKEKQNTVRKFLLAYEQAVAVLNSNPGQYQDLLIEKGRVPEPVRDSFTMPPFSPAAVPTEGDVTQVMGWMIERGLLDKRLAYDQIVDASLLPK